MKEKGIAFQWSADDTDNGSTDVTTSAGSGQNKPSLADMKTKRFLMHKAGFEKDVYCQLAPKHAEGQKPAVYQVIEVTEDNVKLQEKRHGGLVEGSTIDVSLLTQSIPWAGTEGDGYGRAEVDELS